jgi:hypothetical protein
MAMTLRARQQILRLAAKLALITAVQHLLADLCIREVDCHMISYLADVHRAVKCKDDVHVLGIR